MSKLILNPDAYLAAFLTFHEALPTALSSDLPEALYNATAFNLANPVPFASFEYMLALADTHKLGHIAFNVSLTAIDHMSPEVLAYALALMQPAQHAPIELVGVAPGLECLA